MEPISEYCRCPCHSGGIILHDRNCCYTCSRCGQTRIRMDAADDHEKRCPQHAWCNPDSDGPNVRHEKRHSIFEMQSYPKQIQERCCRCGYVGVDIGEKIL